MKKSYLVLLLCVLCFNSLSQLEGSKSIFTFDVTKFVLPTLSNVGSMSGMPFTGITTNYVHYPRLTVGYTRILNEKFNVGIDVGYGNKILSIYKVNKDYQLIRASSKNRLFPWFKKEELCRC